MFTPLMCSQQLSLLHSMDNSFTSKITFQDVFSFQELFTYKGHISGVSKQNTHTANTQRKIR